MKINKKTNAYIERCRADTHKDGGKEEAADTTWGEGEGRNAKVGVAMQNPRLPSVAFGSRVPHKHQSEDMARSTLL
jgi:hypothetical protein